MKLLGYQRIKRGDLDFVNLYIEEESVQDNAECGGSQISSNYSKDRGIRFPSVSADEFAALLREGLRSGCSIECYRRIRDNHLVVKVVRE